MTQRNRKKSSGPVKKFNVHRVAVTRGLETITTEATDFELRILRAQHPPENVKVVESNVAVREVPDNCYALHAQLCSKFDTKNRKVVGALFPTPEALGQQYQLAVPNDLTGYEFGPKKSSQADAKEAERKREAQANLGGPIPGTQPQQPSNPNTPPPGGGLGDAATAGDQKPAG